MLELRRPEELRSRTSSTYLFSTLLRSSPDPQYDNLAFTIEPRIVEASLETPVSFDYAIVDLRDNKVMILAEVKRLSTLRSIGEYLEEFLEKVQRVLYFVGNERIVLHVHLAPPLCSERSISGSSRGLRISRRLRRGVWWSL